MLTNSSKSTALVLKHIFITVITDNLKQPYVRTKSRIEIKFVQFVVTVKENGNLKKHGCRKRSG